jgi:Putative Actinobacterial Holin-X, holin superfamily III
MADKGLPQLAKDVANDLKRLARLEVQLAGEQVKRGMRKRAVAIGAAVTALAFLLYALWFLLASAAAGLSNVVPRWAALLIVGGALVLAAAGLIVLAALSLRSAGSVVPEDTKHSVKEDVRSLKAQSS